MSTTRFEAVVPAAGAARRFGGAKLLADVDGEPLLQHTLRSLLGAPIDRLVLVVPPDHAFDTVPLSRDNRVTLIVNPDPDRGMFSSILIGLASITPASAVLVLPADMPFIRSETAVRLIAAHEQFRDAVVASCGGRRGHPLLVPATVWPQLLASRVEANLKTALADAGVVLREVDVDDPGVLKDVDVPGDLGLQH